MVRYEDLVEEPAARLTAACDWLRPAPAEAIRYAVGRTRWRGSGRATPISISGRASPISGSVCCPPGRRKIAARHQELFLTLGYLCDPDRKLTKDQADANWHALEFASLKEECRMARSQLLKIEHSLRGERLVELQAKLQSRSRSASSCGPRSGISAPCWPTCRHSSPLSADQQLNDTLRGRSSRASFSSRSAYRR